MTLRYHSHQCHDGTTLALTAIDGDGSPIVVLHGFSGDATSMLPLASALDERRPKLLIDVVGHGRSDAPSHLFAYEMGSVVDQVLSIVAMYPERSVDLVGYSMGGRIALSAAVRAPRFFRSLTTLSSMAGIADPAARSARYEADQTRADEVERLGAEVFITNWLAQPLFDSLRRSMSSDELGREIARRATAHPIGWANSLRNTGTGSMPPVWDELQFLDFPVLAIAGSLDTRYVTFAEQLCAGAASGHIGVVDGAGHALHVENPGEVARQINEFL